MTQYKLVLPPCNLANASAASEILESIVVPEALAVTMFEASVAAWTVEAYFEEEPDRQTLSTALTAVLPPNALQSLIVTPLPDENWVALSQAALPPVHAGRFVIHGSHDRAVIGKRTYAIEIDAGEAFGTAHHATTKGCLLALGRLARKQHFKAVLDLGCGSAILAIAAAKALPGVPILASDIDPQATIVARRNVKLNGCAGQVEVITADGLNHGSLRPPKSFALILANILAAPLVTLAKGLAAIAQPGAIAILSGLLNEQADEVIASYNAAGFIVVNHQRVGEWSTLTLQRRLG